MEEDISKFQVGSTPIMSAKLNKLNKMSKTLTEELIQERLEDKGWSVPHETHQEDRILALELEYGFNIVKD